MRATAMACLGAWLLANGATAATKPPPVRLIFDTDIMGDADDVGAVAVLHALADLGEAEVLAMGVSSKNPWSPLCLSALNTYFGRGDIPLGVLRGPGSSKRSRYARQIAEEFPRKLKSVDGAPDAALVYRKVLAARSDKSVVIVTVGFLSNLRNLLMTRPDGLSPLDGRELVARRVKAWVCMGGQFPQGREACNFRRDAPAAAYVIEHWPTTVVFSGGELGIRVQTGAGLGKLPANSPVRRAYELYNGVTNRASWDQTAVLYAVRGLSGGLRHVWNLHTGGSIGFDAETAYVKWREEGQRDHAYLVEKMPPEQVARMVEDLMLHLPGRREEAEPPPWTEGSTTLAVLPDTEVYSKRYPQHFGAQTRWVLDNRRKRNIAYVIHLGDITQRNAPAEWEVARRCLGMLDGRVPYALVPGNHDYDDNAPKRDTTRLTEYFPLEAIDKWPTFGGVHEKGKLDNSYHLLTIGDRAWIILALECGPRDEVVAWANKVLDRHVDRLAIVVTHAYLFRDNTRYDHTSGRSQRASPHGWGNDGEELWQKLVRRHRNAMIVLSGHVSTGGLGYLASEADYGNTVHQMMVDYEKMRGGGIAYMRLLEFLPDGKTVQVRTYSPALKSTRRSDLEEFRFELRLADRDRPRSREDDRGQPPKAPIHRYSFEGGGAAGARLTDSIGGADGVLRSETGRSRLDGKGRLVLAGNDRRAGCVELPPRMLASLTDVSVEVWFTPTAREYNWNSVWRFGDGGGDFLWYVFRTLTVHRAEIAVARQNEDIQRKRVPASPGKQMHIVVAYDDDGADGRPLLTCYRDGRLAGRLVTTKQLSQVDDTQNRLGPIAGVYEELRVYDYALGPEAVRRSFAAGPEKRDRAGAAGPAARASERGGEGGGRQAGDDGVRQR